MLAKTSAGRHLLARSLLLAGLALLIAAQCPSSALPWPFQSSPTGGSPQTSSTSSSSSTVSLIRLRASRLRRPESCRDQLPRKLDELPPLVAIGRVREVYLSGSEQPPVAGAPTSSGANNSAAAALGAEPHNNRALVTLQRVLKGKSELVNTDIVVTNFNASNPALTQCPNFVKPNDTLILLLTPEQEARKYSIVQGGNLLSMNLNNLDKINALVSEDPALRRSRPPIEDILCEAHYCPFGRCRIVDQARNQVRCECPDSCPSELLNFQQQQQQQQQPVCGSDNVTYATECHLVREGCRLKRPLFVTKESVC